MSQFATVTLDILPCPRPAILGSRAALTRIRAVADRWEEGYVALAPDLFWRLKPGAIPSNALMRSSKNS
jgi:dienelactone hydrolase